MAKQTLEEACLFHVRNRFCASIWEITRTFIRRFEIRKWCSSVLEWYHKRGVFHQLWILGYHLVTLASEWLDSNLLTDADLCLKCRRAPRYCVHCVEQKCTDCTNKWFSLFETTYIYKDFNVGHICVLIVRVQSCECSDTKMWKLKNLNVYLSNKFQGRLSTWNFHPLPIHRSLKY